MIFCVSVGKENIGDDDQQQNYGCKEFQNLKHIV